MIRKIIKIDEIKCDGCGLCADACHEGAIGMIDGKAKLLRDDYCDGLGNCLPICPTGAITFEEREAAEYDEAAVMANQTAKHPGHAGGCPGSRSQVFDRDVAASIPTESPRHGASGSDGAASHDPQPAPASQLRQWPVQIKLVPVNAPCFENADLLIAADCAAYAHGNFHAELMRGKITLIGCPKLDDGDYSEKLAEILRRNSIKSVTVARMEVPCCGGIEHAAATALKNSGKMIPWRVVTLSTGGDVLEGSW